MASHNRFILPALILTGLSLVLGGILLLAWPNLRVLPNNFNQEERVTQLIFSKFDDLPLLITDNGRLLAPADNGEWQVALGDPQTHIRGAYVDETTNDIWVATNHGVKVLHNQLWEDVNQDPSIDIIPFEGSIVSIDDNHDTHTLQGADVPALAQNSPDQVLLLDDQHKAVRSGTSVYIVMDSAEWQFLEASAPITDIWRGPSGELLANTPDGVMRWGVEAQHWVSAYPNVSDKPFEDFQVFQGVPFATVDGALFQFENDTWQPVTFGQRGSAYLSQLELGQQGNLWVLDTAGGHLWSTPDGINWEETAIRIADSTLPRG